MPRKCPIRSNRSFPRVRRTEIHDLACGRLLPPSPSVHRFQAGDSFQPGPKKSRKGTCSLTNVPTDSDWNSERLPSKFVSLAKVAKERIKEAWSHVIFPTQE